MAECRCSTAIGSSAIVVGGLLVANGDEKTSGFWHFQLYPQAQHPICRIAISSLEASHPQGCELGNGIVQVPAASKTVSVSKSQDLMFSLHGKGL